MLNPSEPKNILLGSVDLALASLPDASVDLVIADPPYGLGKDAGWDMVPDYGVWIQEVSRLLKPMGTAYIFGTPEIVAAHWSRFPEPKRWITWQVSNRTTPSARNWQPTQEAIVMLWKGKTPWFNCDAVREPYTPGYERSKGRVRPATLSRFGNRTTRYSDAPGALPRDVIRGPGLSGPTGKRESLGHPCQKPLWLMERLIKASCPVGGLVLDLYAGTATASVAAQRLGRSWIAVERDARWGQIALERLLKEGSTGAQIVHLPKPMSPIEVRFWQQDLEARMSALETALKDMRYEHEASI